MKFQQILFRAYAISAAKNNGQEDYALAEKEMKAGVPMPDGNTYRWVGCMRGQGNRPKDSWMDEKGNYESYDGAGFSHLGWDVINVNHWVKSPT